MFDTYFSVMNITFDKGVMGEYTQQLTQSCYWQNADVPKGTEFDSIVTQLIGGFFEVHPEEWRETRYIFVFKNAGNYCQFIDLIYRIGVDREWWRHSQKPATGVSVNWLMLGKPPEFLGIEP